ncbi:MAG: hypothetical protein CMM87_00230 [Rickettsiales bacterium]|nr:hypothetical protein [Rickettsiales bacterium]
MTKVINIENFIMTSKKQKRERPKNTYELGLQDIKIKILSYFPETMDRSQIQVSPVNLACAYERILLNLCKVVFTSSAQEKAIKVAEFLYDLDSDELNLASFIECISKDDLLLTFFRVEAERMSPIDRMFLINVLKTKFPKEEGAIQLMKCLLFMADQRNASINKGIENRI